MTSHIYVNNNTYSVSVSLPTGGRFDVKPGHAVCGKFFQRLSFNQILIPMEGVPKRNQRMVVIHDPLGVREEDTFQGAPKAQVQAETAPETTTEPPSSNPEPAPEPEAGQDPEEIVVEETSEEVALDMFEEKPREIWAAWIRTSQESTINQKFSVEQLKIFAQFMGLEELDGTKAETISQLKELVEQ